MVSLRAELTKLEMAGFFNIPLLKVPVALIFSQLI